MGVTFSRMFAGGIVVMLSYKMMTMSEVGMVMGPLVMSFLVRLRGFLMMMSCLFVVFGGLLVMFCKGLAGGHVVPP